MSGKEIRVDLSLEDNLVEPVGDLNQIEKMVFINTERPDVAELLNGEFSELVSIAMLGLDPILLDTRYFQ